MKLITNPAPLKRVKRRYVGEEAQQLTAREVLEFHNRMARMTDADWAACVVPAPASIAAVVLP